MRSSLSNPASPSTLNFQGVTVSLILAERAWLRIQRLIRSILEVRRDAVTRPMMKATLKDALKEGQMIRLFVIVALLTIAGCAQPKKMIWYNSAVDNQTAQVHFMQCQQYGAQMAPYRAKTFQDRSSLTAILFGELAAQQEAATAECLQRLGYQLREAEGPGVVQQPSSSRPSFDTCPDTRPSWCMGEWKDCGCHVK